jgi:hypothetical protein
MKYDLVGESAVGTLFTRVCKEARAMRRTLIVALVAVLASTALPGCAQETETANDPKSVVLENVKAMENKDLEKTMATIDEESEAYKQTKLLAKRLFDTYDLKYELDSVKVLAMTDAEARVECLQTTRKVSGPVFRDNKIDIVHMLRKTDGKWKIYGSQVKKIDYLN